VDRLTLKAYAAIERLGTIFRREVGAPMRLGSLAGFALLIVLSSQLARVGTTAARTTAAVLLGVLAIGQLWYELYRSRAWQRPETIVKRAVGSADRNLADRTLRALRLADRAASDPSAGSAELAALHLTRLVSRAHIDLVGARAAAIGQRLRRSAAVLGLVALGALLLVPLRVVEGLDVLVARRGIAPLPMDWLDEPSITSRPPEYLHQQGVVADVDGSIALPRGSVLSVRGTPRRPSRRLVLSDGLREVPFVDDASGGVVARWPLEDSVDLRVMARFGGVLVPAPRAIHVASIADAKPVVVLEGAPRTIKLLDVPVIDVRYEATDDHGMREVDLVLASGPREERRVLARLDGEAKHDRGGYRLRATDSFFQRAYGPVEVTVEARDNDAVTGPKWGRSASLTVIPPLVGEPEVLRFAALSKLRDAVVDAAGFRIDTDPAPLANAAAREEHLSAERERTDQMRARLSDVIGGSFGGLRLPHAAQMLGRGQLRKLDEALAREIREPTQASHAAHRTTTEDAALVVDAALRRIDYRDAGAIARRLSEVADDAALGAHQADSLEERDRGVVRMQAALGVLDGGAAQLEKLGALGRDLGEVVASDVKRIRFSRGIDDFRHAELAARDLAARLRRPLPSFGSGRRGGVEAGGSRPSGSEEGSEAAHQIAREQAELDELSRDHGAELGSVEQALAQGSELDELRRQAKEHARAIRDAVRDLPRRGDEPGTAESAASAAREHAQAMADDLERGDPAEAAKSGRRAMDQLRQAQKSPLGRFAFAGDDPRGDARRAGDKLEPELRWAERELERLREAASRRAADDLRRAAPREQQMAERTLDLRDRGKDGAGALPGTTLDLLQEAERAMREAGRALGDANGDRALERQREAQRLLDMARSGDDGAEEPDPKAKDGQPNDGDGEKANMGHANVPRAQDHKSPEVFRRRVLEGLGAGADPRWRGAVRRYAEGLLR
jgi:hypothetical protein